MAVLDPVAALALRILVSAVFAAAAVHKLRDVAGFARAIDDYALAPKALAAPLAVAFAGAEVFCAAALWLPATHLLAAFGAVALLSVYAAAIAINLMRGRRDMDCGCAWSGAGQPISGWLVVRNGVLAGAALLCALPVGGRPVGMADVSIGLLAGLALIALMEAGNTLLGNAPRLARLREWL